MLSYLKETLGLSVAETPWLDSSKLPLYLQSGRTYSVLIIESKSFLLIRQDIRSFHLNSFQKQEKKLRDFWNDDVILCFQRLTASQRKALIEAKISFIVPNSQLYLPSLGLILQEKAIAEHRQITKLSAISQCLLLFLLYYDNILPLKKSELSRQLNVSAMHITRAVQELLSLELVTIRKSGRSEYVLPAYTGKQLYESARPFLIDPVWKRVFVRPCPALLESPLSGESALSERSMLNPPAVQSRAVDRKTYRQWHESGLEEIDPAWYSGSGYLVLEIWKYDPALFASACLVDVVSLMASFADHSDERVEMAIDEMMEAMVW